MAYKKNIAEKKASGTYNVTRERGRANISPVYDIKHISKPDFLDENAKKIWDFAVSQLSEEHVKSLDFGVFSRWCSLFSDFCQVTQAIQEGGLLVSDEETGTGMMNNLYDSKIKISNAFIKNELGSRIFRHLDEFFYDINMSVVDMGICDYMDKLTDFKSGASREKMDKYGILAYLPSVGDQHVVASLVEDSIELVSGNIKSHGIRARIKVHLIQILMNIDICHYPS